MSLDQQRITITIETPDMPCNDTIAAHTLLDVIEKLQHDGIYPSRISLEITTIPTTH
jgi:hypothetical protein